MAATALSARKKKIEPSTAENWRFMAYSRCATLELHHVRRQPFEQRREADQRIGAQGAGPSMPTAQQSFAVPSAQIGPDLPEGIG
jgi:hypothetical protein